MHKKHQVALRKRSGVCVRGKWQCSSLGRYSYDWRTREFYRGVEDIELSDGERAAVETLIKAKSGDAATLRLNRAFFESNELRALSTRLGLKLKPVRRRSAPRPGP